MFSLHDALAERPNCAGPGAFDDLAPRIAARRVSDRVSGCLPPVMHVQHCLLTTRGSAQFEPIGVSASSRGVFKNQNEIVVSLEKTTRRTKNG